MRSAALVFGVLATGLGIWALAYGNLQTGLAATTTIGGDATVAKDVLYAIVVLGLLGALLALPWPRVGGVLLLLVAVAWAAAAFLAGHALQIIAWQIIAAASDEPERFRRAARLALERLNEERTA